jgi:hypothetical protein
MTTEQWDQYHQNRGFWPDHWLGWVILIVSASILMYWMCKDIPVLIHEAKTMTRAKFEHYTYCFVVLVFFCVILLIAMYLIRAILTLLFRSK